MSGPGGQGWEGVRGRTADSLSPPSLPPGLGFAVRSWTVTAAESLMISDLVACWGSRSRRGRVCASPRTARAHVRTSGSGSAPLREARTLASLPGGRAHPAAPGSSERSFPIRHSVSVLQVCAAEGKVQWVNGGARKDVAAGSGVLISLLGRSWGLRSGDAPTCVPWRKETVIGLERREGSLCIKNFFSPCPFQLRS